MKLIISFLEEQGIEDFDTDCVRVKSSYGEKLKEFIVLDDEFFVCEEGESLWSSNPNSFEFTLLHADQKTERCQNKVFRIPTQDFSIKEVYQPNRTINILNKDKIVFSIEGN